MKNCIVFATIVALSATPAAAFWDTQQSAEDIFGNTNVTVSAYGDNGGLIRLECGTQYETPIMAYLLNSGGQALGVTLDMTFIVRSTTGAFVRDDAAQLMDWNETFWAVVTTDQAVISAMIGNMETATTPIPVGIENLANGWRHSDTFSQEGSTSAARAFRDGCM